MIMKAILATLLLIISISTDAQYYYNDIIGTAEISKRMKIYTTNHVRSVIASGTDQFGAKSTDFNEWQEIMEKGRVLKIITRNGQDKTILYYRFDDQGRVNSLLDSSNNIESNSIYQYSPDGRLVSIENITKDLASSVNQKELHIWEYNAEGKPVKAWRILNGNDSTEIRFNVDENGNVSDEQVYKRGRGTDPIFYYYDDQQRLTDIVRFNKKANRLLPDFMFEYDEKGRVVQKITTLSTFSLGYLIWRYIYDERDLKTKEALFNKDKQLTGRIDYIYTFGW